TATAAPDCGSSSHVRRGSREPGRRARRNRPQHAGRRGARWAGMDRMTTAVFSPALHEPPAAVRVRGTLALVAGAGESSRVYERLGRRLAVDGYVVGVFETSAAGEAVGWLHAQGEGPRVLAGSDRGGAAALALAAGHAAVDG